MKSLQLIWQNRTIILAIVAAFFFYSTIRIGRELSLERADKNEVIKAYSQSSKEAKEYQNKYGQIVNRVEAVTLENKSLKKMIAEGYMPQLKGLEGVKKNVKNLESVVQSQTKIIDSLKVKSQRIDTVYVNAKGDTVRWQRFKARYEDKFSVIEVDEMLPGEALFEYSVGTGKQTIALFWKKKWFFGKRKYYGEAVCENPKAKVDSLVIVRGK